MKPLAEGDNPAGEVPGYELVETINTGTGNVLHVFKPRGSEQPTDPMAPEKPEKPATSGEKQGAPMMPSAPVNGKAPQAPVAPSEAKGQAALPNTGTEDHASLAALGLLGVLSGFGLVARKKKED